MTELVEEVKVEASQTQTIEYFIHYILGAIEIILVFRFVLKLLGASLASGFVRLIYALGGIFTLPFEGIFRRAVAQGVETASVFEPATIVAMIVYAIFAWGIVKLVRISSGEKQVE